jgi:HemY protein
MRWLLSALLLLAATVGVALMLQRDPGTVYMHIGQWTVETSLAVLLAFLVVVFVVLYALLRITGAIMRLPRRWRRGRSGRQSEKSRRGLTRGLIEMAEGRWEQAEKYLSRHATDSDTSLLNYLAAARAAQQAGAYDRRDHYLKAAIEENPEADVAVSLTQAELQLAHRQTEHALATLTRLRSLAPQHTYVMKLLARLYAELEDWERLGELLPELRRRKVFDANRLERLERATAFGRIERAGADSEALQAVWDSLPKSIRGDGAVLHAFVEQLIRAGEHALAERRLRQHLGREWDETLAHDYGRVQLDDPGRQLEQAENWLHNHGRSPMLLLTLGRLCVRNQLWGKARIYFESSIGVEPRAETYFELANLLDELGEFGPAREQYRAGLAKAIESGDATATRCAPRIPRERLLAGAADLPEQALLPNARPGS